MIETRQECEKELDEMQAKIQELILAAAKHGHPQQITALKRFGEEQFTRFKASVLKSFRAP